MLIGSTAYRDKMKKYSEEKAKEGDICLMPAFDDHPADVQELQICANNLMAMEHCDVVHIFWDGRSTGTIFDLGMAFALRKPVKLVYLNSKTMQNLFMQYSAMSETLLEQEMDAVLREEDHAGNA